jgi:hypothetical protein
MNRHLCLTCVASLSLPFLLALSGCGGGNDEPPGGFNRGRQTAATTTTAPVQPTPAPETTVTTRTESRPPTSAPVQQAPADYPYATPVAGKPGFVTSPHAPEAGLVDVRGMSPGQQARDPYTGKIFLVP